MNDHSNGNLRHGDNRRGDNNIVVDSTIDSTSSLVSSSNNHSEEERKPLDADEMSAINAIENNFLASTTSATSFGSEYVRNHDGSMLLDHKSRPITIAKILATKPLRHELATRPGPGNRKLTYMSGDSVTRILNDVFGFDGWCLEVKSANRVDCIQDDKKRFHVAYTATVRVTHRRSGAFKEDCGSGDAIDKSLGTAVSHALKASVTDAMKRAVRHFGDKLGNSLYEASFNMNKAPTSLREAIDTYDMERSKFRFEATPQIQSSTLTSNTIGTGSHVVSNQISASKSLATPAPKMPVMNHPQQMWTPIPNNTKNDVSLPTKIINISTVTPATSTKTTANINEVSIKKELTTKSNMNNAGLNLYNKSYAHSGNNNTRLLASDVKLSSSTHSVQTENLPTNSNGSGIARFQSPQFQKTAIVTENNGVQDASSNMNINMNASYSAVPKLPHRHLNVNNNNIANPRLNTALQDVTNVNTPNLVSYKTSSNSTSTNISMNLDPQLPEDTKSLHGLGVKRVLPNNDYSLSIPEAKKIPSNPYQTGKK